MRACGARCRTASFALAGLAGAGFGAGLILAGMTQPARVIGFFDLTRAWDPTLAFVLGGAVLVYGLATRWIGARRGAPWFDLTFHLPTRRDIDRPLVAGAALFGVGWGLGGLCPGPGLVSMAGSSSAVVFVIAMLLGMVFAARFKP